MRDWNLGKGSGGECEEESARVVRVEGRCGWSGACTYSSKRGQKVASSDAEIRLRGD